MVKAGYGERSQSDCGGGVSECVVAFMTGTFVLHVIRGQVGDRPTRDWSLGVVWEELSVSSAATPRLIDR
jgi:hypothetical protein